MVIVKLHHKVNRWLDIPICWIYLHCLGYIHICIHAGSVVGW